VDFAFTEEQELLRNQAREWLERHYGVERVAELADSEAGWEPGSWRELAELGWTGVSIPEEQGGAGLGFLEEAVLFEELGRALYPGPYFATVGLALPALRGRPDLLEAVASGETSWTLALGEGALVPDLMTADRVALVNDEGIWVVDGGSREGLETMDSTRRLGRLGLEGARLEPLISAEDVGETVARIRERALVALALEAVGIASRALELGIAHASNRQQFDRPIGVYQAVSHALADTYVETELARSLALWAAWTVSEGDEAAPVAASAAKAAGAEAATLACERSIQVHGGIGFTWEHILHRLYKRAQWIDAWEGSAGVHRAAVAASLLDGARVPA